MFTSLRYPAASVGVDGVQVASIKKVLTNLELAQRQIEVLRARHPDADVLPALESLHAALNELTGIVRSDRV